MHTKFFITFFLVPFCKLLYVWSGWENEISLSLCFLACTVVRTTYHLDYYFFRGKKRLSLSPRIRQIESHEGRFDIILENEKSLGYFYSFFVQKLCCDTYSMSLDQFWLNEKLKIQIVLIKLKKTKMHKMYLYVVVFINSKKKSGLLMLPSPNSTYDYPSFMTKGCLFCTWYHSSCAFFVYHLRDCGMALLVLQENGNLL